MFVFDFQLVLGYFRNKKHNYHPVVCRHLHLTDIDGGSQLSIDLNVQKYKIVQSTSCGYLVFIMIYLKVRSSTIEGNKTNWRIIKNGKLMGRETASSR